MKWRKSVRTLLTVLVMALMLSAVTPAVLPDTHTVEAAKKKTSKKSAKVNLKINTGMTKVKVGKSVTLKVSGNAKKAVKWSTTSKCVKLSKKSGTKIKVKGVQEGVAAVIAKVGSARVVCCVYVGKATYADASSKTKKALGSPIKLLAAYIAKHPISVQTGNTGTGKSSWEGKSSDNEIYSLSVVGENLVVSETYSSNYTGTNYSENSSTSSTMSIPINGSVTANITYNSTYSEKEPDYSYNSNSTYSFQFNINTVAAGTEITYNCTRTYGNTTETNKETDYFRSASNSLVDVLNCFLVDNNTGFTAKDIGFKAYSASHRNIGKLTTEDMAAFSQQVASIRAYNKAHYVPYDD